MKKVTKFQVIVNILVFLVAIIFVFLIAGCSTIDTQFGRYSGLGIGSGQIGQNANPTLKVDPSQTAYKGAEGHAAALALGDIADPVARADAKEAMIAVSENDNIWNRGVRGSNSGNIGAVDERGRSAVIAGISGAYGRMYNPFEYPITVVIVGLGSPYTFGPGEVQELLIPHGDYDAVVYNTSLHQMMGHNHFDTSTQKKWDDKIYNFIVRLDAQSNY